ncbi:MAG: STAS domain-containing protein [Planctomycetia bacterium]|nr:STAS domain-containing protein [Planctomycetia bacterium]
MADYKRIEVREVSGIAVVQFRDAKYTDELRINELGQELLELVENGGYRRIVLNFGRIEFFSSGALGKLITLDKRVRSLNGTLVCCNIQPDIFEVFKITRLDRFLKIHDTEDAALNAVK